MAKGWRTRSFANHSYLEESISRSGITTTPNRSIGLFLWVVCLLSLCFFYTWLGQALSHNSDNATVVLEARSILGGNLLLNHWGLPADNFWSLDVPYYPNSAIETWTDSPEAKKTIFLKFLPDPPPLDLVFPFFIPCLPLRLAPPGHSKPGCERFLSRKLL